MPFTVKPDGEMICRYVMPCKQNIRIILENTGSLTVTAKGADSGVQDAETGFDFFWVQDI